MMRLKGSTNGFCFSDSLAGGGYNDPNRFVVVQTRGNFFHAVPKAHAKRAAVKHRALGFWRLKTRKLAGPSVEASDEEQQKLRHIRMCQYFGVPGYE